MSIVQPVSGMGLVSLAVFSHMYLKVRRYQLAHTDQHARTPCQWQERLTSWEWAAVALAGVGTLSLGMDDSPSNGVCLFAHLFKLMLLLQLQYTCMHPGSFVFEAVVEQISRFRGITTVAGTGGVCVDCNGHWWGSTAAGQATGSIRSTGSQAKCSHCIWLAGGGVLWTVCCLVQSWYVFSDLRSVSTLTVLTLRCRPRVWAFHVRHQLYTGMLLASGSWLWFVLGMAASIMLTSSGLVLQNQGFKDGNTVLVCTCAAVTAMVAGVAGVWCF